MSDKKVPQPDVNVGENVEVDTSREAIIEDKMENEDILRDHAHNRATDPDDMPGFEDGVKGGWDGEVREGNPNVTTPDGSSESDAEGDVEAGAGAKVSGGIDGGPQ